MAILAATNGKFASVGRFTVESFSRYLIHDPDSGLTATIDILRAIARGHGPQNAVLALGYAGWGAGQLELELQANGWLNCPADSELIFNTAADIRYEMALRRIGIEPAMLSMEAGHA